MIQLDELFGNRSSIKILTLLINNSNTEFPQKEIKSITKLAKATLTKWLKTLEEKDFIKIRKQGVTKLYKLNKHNNIIKYLKILNNILILNKIIAINSKYNIKTYLYGSSSRGEDTEKSDIDLLMIGKIKKEIIIKDINKIADEIKRRIKIEIFSQLEWSAMARKDKAFYERVEKDKIEII